MSTVSVKRVSLSDSTESGPVDSSLTRKLESGIVGFRFVGDGKIGTHFIVCPLAAEVEPEMSLLLLMLLVLMILLLLLLAF